MQRGGYLALKVVGSALGRWRNDLFAHMQVASASADAAIDATRGLRGCAPMRVTVARLPYVVALTCGTGCGMYMHPESPKQELERWSVVGVVVHVARVSPALHLPLLLTA